MVKITNLPIVVTNDTATESAQGLCPVLSSDIRPLSGATTTAVVSEYGCRKAINDSCTDIVDAENLGYGLGFIHSYEYDPDVNKAVALIRSVSTGSTSRISVVDTGTSMTFNYNGSTGNTITVSETRFHQGGSERTFKMFNILDTAVVTPSVSSAGESQYGWLVGGNVGTALVSQSNYMFDSSNGTMSVKTSKPTASSEMPTGMKFSDNIHVPTGRGSLTTHEAYSISSDTWTTKTAMTNPRIFGASASDGDYGYVFGGVGYETDVERYSDVSDTWASRNAFPYQSYGHSCEKINGVVYMVWGGYGTSTITPSYYLQTYDPNTDAYSDKANQPNIVTYSGSDERCYNHYGIYVSTFSVGNRLYTVSSDRYYYDSYVMTSSYDTGTDTWKRTTDIPSSGEKRVNASGIRLAGYGYLFGGENGESQNRNTIYKFNASNNVWYSVSPMSENISRSCKFDS